MRAIGVDLHAAAAEALLTCAPARRFRELRFQVCKSWRRSRRVVAKAQHTRDKSNPRIVVTSLSTRQCATHALYEDFCCAPEGSGRTASRNASPTCSPTDSRPRSFAVTNYACGEPQQLTY